jgi:hypothetical protein
MRQHPDLIVARVLLIPNAGRRHDASLDLDRLHRRGPQVLGDGRTTDDISARERPRIYVLAITEADGEVPEDL